MPPKTHDERGSGFYSSGGMVDIERFGRCWDSFVFWGPEGEGRGDVGAAAQFLLLCLGAGTSGMKWSVTLFCFTKLTGTSE